MINSANAYPVSQLFDIDSKVVYFVPLYQREYSWRKSHWESFFDDLMENNSGYFLGSIICVNKSEDTLADQWLELVDGQQRFTTLTLLYAAIYNALSELKTGLADELNAELLNLKRRLVLKSQPGQVRLVPQIQNDNKKDYFAVLSKNGILENHSMPPYAGNRRVFRSYYYFQERINTLTEGRNNKLEIVMDVLEKVNQACLVKIEVGSHADAYTLFESLNNRGMPLTAVDLIKNKLLARLDVADPGQIDSYFKRWSDFLGKLSDNYTVQDRFFRQYYNAFREELKTIVQVPVATRSNLIQIYEKLIDHNAKDCLTKLCDAGSVYSQIISNNQNGVANSLQIAFKNLERIQGAPSYLLLLYLLMRKNSLGLTDVELTSIVNLLVKFFVRRNLTDKPATRDLIRLFMTVVENISVLQAEEIPLSIERQLVKVSASDDQFRSELEGPIYDENVGATRFILCSLEEQAMTEETNVDLWKRTKNNKYSWTIEHIFPQGKNIPKCWVDMIAAGDEDKAKEVQQSHVHKLGNLTITVFNSSLGNMSFQEKRDLRDTEKRAIGYNNGLKLNKELAVLDKWSIEQIDDRTNELVSKAMSLFQLKS